MINKEKGFSLLEILIVITIFAGLGLLTTRAVFLTLRSSQKASSEISIRRSLDYSLAVIERHLRGADSIVACPNPDPRLIEYLDEAGAVVNFSCQDSSDGGYLASASARLSNREVDITSCSFTCNPGSGSAPPTVTLFLEAQKADVSGIGGANVTMSTQIQLRN